MPLLLTWTLVQAAFPHRPVNFILATDLNADAAGKIAAGAATAVPEWLRFRPSPGRLCVYVRVTRLGLTIFMPWTEFSGG